MYKTQIKEWLPFNDKEIGLLQYFAADYVREHDLDNVNSFVLGCLSAQFQYNMRLIKDLITSNDTKYIPDIIKFIDTINLFDGLCVFIKNKFKISYSEYLIKNQYYYLINDRYDTSFFKRNDIENNEIMKNNWKIISKKINKYSNGR